MFCISCTSRKIFLDMYIYLLSQINNVNQLEKAVRDVGLETELSHCFLTRDPNV